MATISTKPWGSIKESDYKDAAQFCRACLVDDNAPGEPKSKDKCRLPVREPDGTLNRNGLIAAAGRLNQADLSPADRRKAAKALMRLYGMANMPPPDHLKRMAGMM